VQRCDSCALQFARDFARARSEIRVSASATDWMFNTNFPIDLVLVRHGESEGNLAQEKAKQGYAIESVVMKFFCSHFRDNSYWSQELTSKHNSMVRRILLLVASLFLTRSTV
jgi:hypothetical protein